MHFLKRFQGKILGKERIFGLSISERKKILINKFILRLNLNYIKGIGFNSSFFKVGDLVKIKYPKYLVYRGKKFVLIDSVIKKAKK